MASYEQAFAVVMKHEDDPNVPGKITRNDDGRWADKFMDVPSQFQKTAYHNVKTDKWYYGFTRTRYGVDERAHPELRNGGFYSTMSSKEAFAVAETVFRQYWSFDALTDQVIATKLFDLCVNAGRGNALPVLQKALAQLGKGILSWQWGPSIVDAINSSMAADLQIAFYKATRAYYSATAKKKQYSAVPGGWIARAKWGIPAAILEALDSAIV